MEQLGRAAIDRIGHLLLGVAAWEIICRKPFIDWATFVNVVERRFGGSEAHQRGLFLNLTRQSGEDALDFLQRAEDTRCRLGLSDEAALMRTWDQLPHSLKKTLEDFHDMTGRGPVTWFDLVNYAT